MALNIPNVGAPGEGFLKGLNTGSTMFSRIMQPIIQREQLAEQGKYHQGQLTHQEKALQEQIRQHQQDFALRQQVEGRLAAMAPIQRKIAMFQLQQAEREADPVKQMQYFNQMQQQMMGQPSQNQQQTMQPFGGQGMPSAEEMQNPTVNQNNSQNNQGGINLDALKQNPMLRGWFKKQFGYDPLAQTPEQKMASELELFKQKEAIKAENKKPAPGSVPLTGAMQTKLQGVVTGVDNSLPVLEELVTNYKNLPTGTETFNPAAYAAYNSKANAIIEPLINAFGLNVTDATKEMMHDQVFRKTNETREKYRNRLIDLAKEIIRRRNDSFGSLQSGTISPKAMFTGDYFENLAAPTKMINGKLYRYINKEWVE